MISVLLSKQLKPLISNYFIDIFSSTGLSFQQPPSSISHAVHKQELRTHEQARADPGIKDATDLTKPEAEKIVNLFFNEMSAALAKGDRVEIRGLCSFFVKDYKAYTGRNPKTG